MINQSEKAEYVILHRKFSPGRALENGIPLFVKIERRQKEKVRYVPCCFS